MAPKKKQTYASDEETTEEETDEETTEDTTTGSDATTDTGNETESSEEDTRRPRPKVAKKVSPASGPKTKAVENKPHDEEFEVEDGQRVSTPPETKKPQARAGGGGGGWANAEASQKQSGVGTKMANKPHDETFTVEDEHRKTPPGHGDGGASKPAPAAATGRPQAAGASGSGRRVENKPYDETFTVEDEEGRSTPPEHQNRPRPAPAGAGGQRGAPPGAGSGTLTNQPDDEFFTVDDGPTVRTPPSNQQRPAPAGASAQRQPGKLNELRNEQHDATFEVGSQNSVGTPQSQLSSAANSPPKKPGFSPAKASGMMQPPSEEEEETSEEDESVPKMGHTKASTSDGVIAAAPSGLEYNPNDYAHLKVSREVRELFDCITAYQPTTLECPAKLKPFIPDYLPSVGDIDTFCKVPRPDGKADNLGLVIVDEPNSMQSNPAVVKMSIQYQTKQQTKVDNVYNVEDAHNRPQVVEKWINDIKQVHYKKPLPSVTYSKPMPDIERLLQVWPQEVEDLLAGDLQLPGSQIDLDMFQYVRVLCAILDIPTHANLIESLHVMFTLYLEFRANQHFQHA